MRTLKFRLKHSLSRSQAHPLQELNTKILIKVRCVDGDVEPSAVSPSWRSAARKLPPVLCFPLIAFLIWRSSPQPAKLLLGKGKGKGKGFAFCFSAPRSEMIILPQWDSHSSRVQVSTYMASFALLSLEMELSCLCKADFQGGKSGTICIFSEEVSEQEGAIGNSSCLVIRPNIHWSGLAETSTAFVPGMVIASGSLMPGWSALGMGHLRRSQKVGNKNSN